MDVDKNKNAFFFFSCRGSLSESTSMSQDTSLGPISKLVSSFPGQAEKNTVYTLTAWLKKNIQTVFVYLLYFILKRENFFWTVCYFSF